MEPFIRNDQYNFIRKQSEIIADAYNTVNDIAVLSAIKSLSHEKVVNLFIDATEEQLQLVTPIMNVHNTGSADQYIESIKQYVIPFKEISNTTLKRLFPKVKKLNTPKLGSIDKREITYIHWHDQGSNKNFMIVPYVNKLLGLVGTFTTTNKKGICTICGRHEQVGMFLSEKKGEIPGTFIKRGNYICSDYMKCNQNLTNLEKLQEFASLLK